MILVGGKEVGEVAVFGVSPHGFDWVEVGSVRWEPLEADVFVAFAAELLRCRAVGR